MFRCRSIMRISFFILFLFGMSLFSESQILVENTTIDYGEIDFKSDRVVDISFVNMSDKDSYILRSNFSDEYEILWNKRELAKDSTLVLRVKYNPRKKGKFNDKIELWFTTETKPIVLKIKGDVLYVDKRDNPSCPDFNARPLECCDNNEFIVEMIDKETKKGIHKGVVRLVRNGAVENTLITDRSGLQSKDLSISYYLVLADAEGYLPADTAMYVNRFQNYILFEMEKIFIDQEEETFAEEIESDLKTESKIEPEVVLEIEPDISLEVVEDIVADQSDVLPESVYARNNIIFLIDVSSSMNARGKMDILKSSMFELVDALRGIDQITIVTYATNPDVILESTSVKNKDEIKELIRNLEGKGSTSGAKGFQMAYKIAKQNYIEDGNNQIIVATDGAFRVDDNSKIEKLIKKNRARIITSVIGIRSSGSTSTRLEQFSELGNGSFIFLDDFDQSKNALIQEIKKQSKL